MGASSARPELLEALADHFVSRRPAGVISAYLFGSQATGAAHRESDVDVAVVVDREVLPDRGARSDLQVRLTADLIAATHRNDVQVVIVNNAPPELALAAVEGKRFYCTDPEADFRFTLRVRIRYGDIAPWLRRYRRLKLEALRS